MIESKRSIWVISFFLLMVLAANTVGFAQNSLLPPNASTVSDEIDGIFMFIFYVTGFFFVLVIALLLYFIVKYRAKQPGEEGINFHGHMGLEIAWTIVPAVFFIVIAIYSAGALSKIHNPPADAMVINVTGYQFFWHFDYPDDGVQSDGDLIIPVNKPVLLKLRSDSKPGTEKVLHSFWVPAFRLKQDLLPEQERELWFEAKLAGEFPILCAELCGAGHSVMRGTVRVVPADEYRTWVEQEKGKSSGLSDEAKRGMELANARGCIGCHTVDGKTGVGPTWQKLYGKTETLEDGSEATVNDDYIINSIRNPGAQVVKGFLNIMPTFKADAISDAEIKNIIEYIKTLTGATQTTTTTPPTTITEPTAQTKPSEPETSSDKKISPLELGKQLSSSCIGCHSVNGTTTVGPTWLNLYGKTETLADGSKVVVDDEYIVQSVREPGAQIVQGFQPLMPPFAYLSDEELSALIVYIKSLKIE